VVGPEAINRKFTELRHGRHQGKKEQGEMEKVISRYPILIVLWWDLGMGCSPGDCVKFGVTSCHNFAHFCSFSLYDELNEYRCHVDGHYLTVLAVHSNKQKHVKTPKPCKSGV